MDSTGLVDSSDLTSEPVTSSRLIVRVASEKDVGVGGAGGSTNAPPSWGVDATVRLHGARARPAPNRRPTGPRAGCAPTGAARDPPRLQGLAAS
jgi:hypothetical protein